MGKPAEIRLQCPFTSANLQYTTFSKDFMKLKCTNDTYFFHPVMTWMWADVNRNTFICITLAQRLAWAFQPGLSDQVKGEPDQKFYLKKLLTIIFKQITLRFWLNTYISLEYPLQIWSFILWFFLFLSVMNYLNWII